MRAVENHPRLRELIEVFRKRHPEVVKQLGRSFEQPSPEVCSQPAYVLTFTCCSIVPLLLLARSTPDIFPRTAAGTPFSVESSRVSQTVGALCPGCAMLTVPS